MKSFSTGVSMYFAKAVSKWAFFFCLCIFFDASAKNLEKCATSAWARSEQEWQICQQKAHEMNLPMLVIFLGSSWCPWSEKIEKEVLSDGEFGEILSEECFIVKIDLPAKISSDPSCQELQSLANRFEVKESPTLVLMSLEGEVITRKGYFPFQPECFARHILEAFHGYREIKNELRQENASLTEAHLEEMFQKARSLGFSNLQQEIVGRGVKIAKEPFFFLEKYESLAKVKKKKDSELLSLRKKILCLDPKNLKKAHLRLAMIDFSSQLEKKKKKKDTKQVVAPLLNYIQQFGKDDHDNLWKIEMMLAQYFFSKKEIASAVKHAERSLAAAPNKLKGDVMQVLDHIKFQADL